MKASVLGLAAGSLCLSLLASAEPAPNGDAAQPGFITTQRASDIMARDLLGSTVVSPDGKKVGVVEDLVLTPKGVIHGVVINSGGLLGLIGGRSIAVAASRVSLEPSPKHAPGDETIVLVRLSARELEKAPDFKNFRDMGKSAPAK